MLGDKIKILRKNKGITQQELASILGLSRSHIAMMEKNKQGASKETLKKLSGFFDVPIDYFIEPKDKLANANTLGKKVKALRKEMFLTQQELATKLGISQSNLGMIESDNRPAGRNTLVKLSNFFNVSIDFLLSENEDDLNIELSKNLGDKIKKLRKKFGITQQELSNTINVSRSTIGMIESNKQGTSNETLLKLAKALNTTVEYLLSEDEEDIELEKKEEPEFYVPKYYSDKYKVTSRDKKQYFDEMKKATEAFFMNDEFDETAKKEMLDFMSELFWEAKTMNKRKK